MEVKLDNLIEKIKQEGVDEAKRLSEDIVRSANKEAASIIEKAESQAKETVSSAEQEVERLKKSGRDSLRQAARDVVLVVKERISEMFEAAFRRKISQELKAEFVKEMILKVIDNWAQGKEVEILVNKKDAGYLQDEVFAVLKKDLKDSVTIKVSSRISRGFRIGLKGQDAFYDLTDEGLFEALKEFLNPGLAEIVDKDPKDG